jgi:hypothetical protein
MCALEVDLVDPDERFIRTGGLVLRSNTSVSSLAQ